MISIRDATGKLQIFDNNDNVLTIVWIVIIAISISIGSASTLFSDLSSRMAISGPLLTGVLTLFTISLTVTTVGIQVTSSRYSYRVDTTVLQPKSILFHFSPYLLAVTSGILIITSGTYSNVFFWLYISISILSVLSIIPFLWWLLWSITPDAILESNMQNLDGDFLRAVENSVREEYNTRINSDYDRTIRFWNEIQYLHIADNDPTNVFRDVIRSRIHDDDTATAKRLLDQYVSHSERQVANRYRNFRTSHTDSQHVLFYLFGLLEGIFQLSLKNDNYVMTRSIFVTLRRSILRWREKSVLAIPEVFFRIFSAISVEYASECSGSQSHFVAKEYSTISRIISEDIKSPANDVSSAMISTITEAAQDFAIISINNRHYQSASVIVSSLRSIAEAILRKPSGQADRIFVAIGLIGTKFAQEKAETTQVVHIANEVSTRNNAEETITTLVTFKDKIEEFDNGYAFQNRHIEKIMIEINRINSALEEHDSEIAFRATENSNLDDEDAIIAIIRTSRLHRGIFEVSELTTEIDYPLTTDEITSICNILCEQDVFSDRGNNSYSLIRG